MNRTDRGFTLLELVVALMALIVIVAIAAPFIVRSRESSRAESCMDHQRLIGEALLEYETFFHAFPIGAPKDEADWRSMGVMTQVLPLLDEKAVAEEINWSGLAKSNAEAQLRLLTAPPEFHCPADNYALDDKRSISYVVNAGCDAAMLGAESAKPELLGAFDFGDATSLADFADGTGTTALFCERLIGSGVANGTQTKGKAPRDFADISDAYQLATGAPDLFVKACQGVKANHHKWSTALGRNWLASYHYVHVLTPNAKTLDCGYAARYPMEGIISARSYHPGYIQVTFADGRNESFSDQVDPTIWRALGTRAGHDGAPKP